MRRHLALVVLLPGVVACGGGASPVLPTALEPAPPGTPSTRILFVSGETQGPVPSAQVVVDGRRYTTDAAGWVTLETAPSGTPELDVEAPGFLPRRTLLTADRFTLWPSRSPTGLDEAQTAQLVYGCGTPGCAGKGEPLSRVVSGAVLVIPSAEIRSDPAAMASHEAAAEQLSAATQGAVAFSVATKGSGGGTVLSTRVDPGDAAIQSMGAAAVTRRVLGSRGEILEASVVFRSGALARLVPLVLHEFGHVFGLGHSARMGDVMWNGPELYVATGFSSREALTIGLMLQRMPGNRFPDSDGGTMTSGAGGRSSITVCSTP